MPDTPEHPVTLGDLRVPCEHGLDRWHSHHDMSMCDGNHDDPCAAISNCPGGGPATVADLVSALRAEGELILDDLGDCYRYTTLYRYHATGLTMQEAFEAEGGHL